MQRVLSAQGALLKSACFRKERQGIGSPVLLTPGDRTPEKREISWCE